MFELAAFPRIRTVAVTAVALSAPLLCAGCGSSGGGGKPELAQGEALTVQADMMNIEATVSADGNHYAQGRNAFVVSFDPSKTVLDRASAFMPVHGHSTPGAPTITLDAGKYHVSDFIFSMPGLWNVTLYVSLDSHPDKVEFTLDVP